VYTLCAALASARLLVDLSQPVADGRPADGNKNASPEGQGMRESNGMSGFGSREQAAHEPLVSRIMLEHVPLAGLSCQH